MTDNLEPNIIWRAYQIINKKDLEMAIELYKMREKKMPSKALISDRCPDGVAEMIKPFLAQYGIEPEVSHHLLPYDLWLADGNNKTDEKKERIVQKPLF